MSLGDVFEPVRSAFERAEIRYAVGGSWASTAFGEPRFTDNLDVLAEFNGKKFEYLINELPASISVIPEDGFESVEPGAPLNVVHLPTAFKFHLFRADAFPIGAEELDRAIFLPATALSAAPVPFVTPEDILLAKLYWFKLGGERSEVQLRDIEGIVRACSATLDRTYLQHGAAKLEVLDLLDQALSAD